MRMSQSTEQVSEPAGTAGPALAAAARPGLADPGAWAVTAFATLWRPHPDHRRHLEILRGNLFGAVVFGTYGPFWVIHGVLQTLYASGIPANAVNSAVALFLAMFAVLTCYFVIASLRTDMVLVAILALIFIGLVLLAIGAGTSTTGFTRAGGWVTLAFAVLAWYHAAVTSSRPPSAGLFSRWAPCGGNPAGPAGAAR
jgi:uncharacterized protein